MTYFQNSKVSWLVVDRRFLGRKGQAYLGLWSCQFACSKFLNSGRLFCRSCLYRLLKVCLWLFHTGNRSLGRRYLRITFLLSLLGWYPCLLVLIWNLCQMRLRMIEVSYLQAGFLRYIIKVILSFFILCLLWVLL